ncbi:MAG: hypothetical protein LC708_00515, partial [Actinobacteria bacterium]|nr:hypothetical protein [Actinomycetota bacterium]
MYVVHESEGTVSVISTASNTVVATVPVVERPSGVAVSPDGSRVWVTGRGISVIDTATNAVVATYHGVSFAYDL